MVGKLRLSGEASGRGCGSVVGLSLSLGEGLGFKHQYVPPSPHPFHTHRSQVSPHCQLPWNKLTRCYWKPLPEMHGDCERIAGSDGGHHCIICLGLDPVCGTWD